VKPQTSQRPSWRSRTGQRHDQDDQRRAALERPDDKAFNGQALAAATTIVSATATAYGSCTPSSNAQQMNAVNRRTHPGEVDQPHRR